MWGVYVSIVGWMCVCGGGSVYVSMCGWMYVSIFGWMCRDVCVCMSACMSGVG